MKRYFTLLVVSVVIAIALAVVMKRPRSLAPRPLAVAIPEVTLRLTIQPGAVMPPRSAVPKNHRVRLQVLNRGGQSLTLALAGYEDRLGTRAIAAGALWDTSFVADRPGEDFAWLLNGEPAGQLTVTGSHLVEGHR
jgi:hypothetical protein